MKIVLEIYISESPLFPTQDGGRNGVSSRISMNGPVHWGEGGMGQSVKLDGNLIERINSLTDDALTIAI